MADYVSKSQSRLRSFGALILGALLGAGGLLIYQGQAPAALGAQIMAELDANVTSACTQATAGRYPFDAEAQDEISLAEFAAVFAPGGTFDSFFEAQLAALVDTSGATWSWKPEAGDRAGLPQGMLRAFQNAKTIQSVFYPDGGTEMALPLTVTATGLHAAIEQANLSLGADTVVTKRSGNSPASLSWAGGRANLDFEPTIEGSENALGFEGAWGLARLIDGTPSQQRENTVALRGAIGPRHISYRLEFGNDTTLPFTRLRAFQCPTGL